MNHADTCEFGGGCEEPKVKGFRFCAEHLARVNKANEENAR